MNILFLASWYPNRIHPRDGNFVEKHARCVAARHRVWVIHIHEDNNMPAWKLDLEMNTTPFAQEARVYYGNSNRWPALGKVVNRWRAWMKAYHFVRKEGGPFDLVHVHVILYSGLFAVWLKLRHGLPFVITEHSTVYQPGEGLSFVGKLLSRLAARNASAILPVSEDLKEKMQSLGLGGQYSVIPNVVNTQRFHPLEKKAGKGPFRFLHVSDFSERKNIPGMLEAIRKLTASGVDFSFTFAGDGPLQPIQLRAKAMGLLPWLQFRGPMKEAEVAAMMQRHDAFVLFSNYENLPCVLLEAQACGLPIITSEVGGVREIVESPAFGRIIPKGDGNALAAAMKAMAGSRAQYDAGLISERAAARYSEEVAATSFDAVYQAAAR